MHLARSDPPHFDGGASILLLAVTLVGARELVVFPELMKKKSSEGESGESEESEEEADGEKDEEEEDASETDSLKAAREDLKDRRPFRVLPLGPGSLYMATVSSIYHQVCRQCSPL